MTRFNATEALTGAFDRYRNGALVLQQNIDDLRVSTLPEWDAQRELFNIFYRNLLPARFLKPVADSYFSGQDRSTWGLLNACTLHAKNLAPGPNMRAHTRLGKYFGLGKDATCWLETMMASQITSIILYQENNYLHYNDTDIKRGFFHGYHVNKEYTIELLRLYGADEISVIVKNNNPDIPALRRVQEFCDAGYTYIPTPIEGPMKYRLRRIQSDEEGSDEYLGLPGWWSLRWDRDCQYRGRLTQKGFCPVATVVWTVQLALVARL